MVKNRYYIIIFLIFLIGNKAIGYDFYSENPSDPFFSEFNPTYINKEETATGEFELKKFIKKIIEERKEKRAEKERKKAEQEKKRIIEKQEKAEERAKNELKEKPKKHLTKAQLERELMKEEREKERELQKEQEKKENLTLKEKLFNIKKDKGENRLFVTPKKSEEDKYVPPTDPNINITADYMDYYPDTYEIHAVGNAKVVFIAQDTKIEADKIVFDYDKNIIKARENVILTSPDSVTEGDFLKLDLSKPNGWVENPLTKTEDIKIKATDAFIYSDNITEYDGVARILRDDIIAIGGRSFSSYVDQSGILEENRIRLKDGDKSLYKIRANTIIIDAKDEHEVITIKNAGLYLKNHKIGVVPSLKIVTNKMHSNAETNFPEFGSQSMLGTHIGPAVVLNVPGGSTLKLAPILTYSDKKLGIGGIARFRSENNTTEVAYGTSKKELIIRGKQKLAPGFLLNYSRYANIGEWFLGYRMPKYAASLSYSRSDYVKDLDLMFSQLYSAGLYVDDKEHYGLKNNHARFRWMTQTFKPLYSYKNKEGNIGLNLGVVAQTSATIYSQGNTVGLFRFGPALSTQVGRWSQSVMYYLTGQAGDSPFEFDRYRYGKSNVVLVESLKVCKYLSLGYLASISMHNQYRHDYHHDDILQESRFFASVGPDYVKLTLGYDAIRHTMMMFVTMLVGTKDSDVEFKKTIIKNPDKFGKEKKKEKKPKRKSFRKYLKEAKERAKAEEKAKAKENEE